MNTLTRTDEAVATNERGAFIFAGLWPGSYDLKGAYGFKYSAAAWRRPQPERYARKRPTDSRLASTPIQPNWRPDLDGTFRERSAIAQVSVAPRRILPLTKTRPCRFLASESAHGSENRPESNTATCCNRKHFECLGMIGWWRGFEQMGRWLGRTGFVIYRDSSRLILVVA
jgi:hypothetical protein